MENQIQCPKCHSTQITAQSKGFSAGKAAAGAVLTGGLGLLAGTIGSKKIVITCLACGKQFAPGEGAKQSKPRTQPKLPATVWDKETQSEIPNPALASQKKQMSIAIGFFICLALFFFLHYT